MSPLTGLQQAVDLLGQYGDEVELGVRVLASFALVYLVGRYLVATALVELVRARNRKNPTVVDAIAGYLKVAALLAAIVAALVAAGYGHVLSGSAIVIAALTLAIGVAGQEVVGNLVSGIFLVADPDFNVDDWISWPEGEGFVEAVGFRVTRVRTPSNEVITVPNTDLATQPVTRPYGRDRFRIDVRLGISYDDSIDDALIALRDEATAVPDVLENPAPTVRVETLAGDEVCLEAVFWIEGPSRSDVRRVRSAFIKRVKARFEDAGLTISPPSERDLSGRIEVSSESE